MKTNRHLPSLNALRTFEIVAKNSSIKKAASILHVSESAVSRQVKILENQLGIPLFTRSHKGLKITDAGQHIANGVTEAFDHIDKTINPKQSANNTVTLRSLPTFALRWLYPRIHKFKRLHPYIDVQIQTRLGSLRLSHKDVDLGICYGMGNWPKERTTELYQEWITPVCAPNYLNKGKIENITDFDDITLLHPLPDRIDWQIWAEKSPLGPKNPESGLDFDTQDMAIGAAISGYGMAIVDIVLANDVIRNGELITPIPLTIPTGQSYFLVRTYAPKPKRHVDLFHNWLCNEIKQTQNIIDNYTK